MFHGHRWQCSRARSGEEVCMPRQDLRVFGLNPWTALGPMIIKYMVSS